MRQPWSFRSFRFLGSPFFDQPDPIRCCNSCCVRAIYSLRHHPGVELRAQLCCAASSSVVSVPRSVDIDISGTEGWKYRRSMPGSCSGSRPSRDNPSGPVSYLSRGSPAASSFFIWLKLVGLTGPRPLSAVDAASCRVVPEVLELTAKGEAWVEFRSPCSA